MNASNKLNLKQHIQVINQWVETMDPDLDCGIESLNNGYLYSSPQRLRRFKMPDVKYKKWYHILEELGKPFTQQIIEEHQKQLENLYNNNVVKSTLLYSGYTSGEKNIYNTKSSPLSITTSDVIFFNLTEPLKLNQKLQIFYKLIAKLNNHEKIINKFYSEYCNQNINLTLREKQILTLLALGQTPKDIASLLCKNNNNGSLQPSTIYAIINRQLYSKFDVNSVGLLIEKAFAKNLLTNSNPKLALFEQLEERVISYEIYQQHNSSKIMK